MPSSVMYTIIIVRPLACSEVEIDTAISSILGGEGGAGDLLGGGGYFHPEAVAADTFPPQSRDSNSEESVPKVAETTKRPSFGISLSIRKDLFEACPPSLTEETAAKKAAEEAAAKKAAEEVAAKESS